MKIAQFRAKHGDSPPLLGTADTAAVPTHSFILHVDMDAFYVSVELLARPDLKGRPVVVGGGPDQRGVVCAASYEARRYGIQSAIPLRTAAKLCPHAIFIAPSHGSYSEWSDRVATILAKYSPVVEMASIDEAYLDLSGTERLHGPALAAANQLLREITRTTGLPCSGGLASTRLVAKVASDQAKPRGLLWVPPGSEAAFLAPLSVRKIPGIGKVTEVALNSLRIKTVAQLAAMPRERLEQVFGRWGTALHRKSIGQDSYEFVLDGEPKSISHNRTFGTDTNDRAEIESTLSYLGQKAGKRLRDAGLHTRTVSLTLRFTNFKTIDRSRTLSEPTDLDTVILRAVRELFSKAWNGSAPLRLVGVALGSFTAAPGQMELLDAGRAEKLERLARATDSVRDKFGFSKIQLGGSLRNSEDQPSEGPVTIFGKPVTTKKESRQHAPRQARDSDCIKPPDNTN